MPIGIPSAIRESNDGIPDEVTGMLEVLNLHPLGRDLFVDCCEFPLSSEEVVVGENFLNDDIYSLLQNHPIQLFLSVPFH